MVQRYLIVARKKIGLESDGIAEIIDLRMNQAEFGYVHPS